jgi:nitrogen-specific signal transduction histidine kinase
MLGYSDLLSASPLEASEQRLAAEIAAQVRSTRTLVASLLTFAQQAPARMSPVDLNSVVQTAMRLLQPQLETQAITARLELAASLPPIFADSNQLLHVCLHIAGQTRSRVHRGEDSFLYIRTSKQQNVVVLEFTGDAPSPEPLEWPVHYSENGVRPGTLSLSACCRIVGEHGGRILSRNSPQGPVDFRLELPIATQSATKPASSGSAGSRAAASKS